MALSSRSDVFTLDYFRTGFDLEEFLGRLCQDAEAAKEEDSEETKSTNPVAKAKETKRTVHALLEHFRKSESRLRGLHLKVTQQLHEAQSQLEAEQTQYKEVIEVIDRQFGDLRRDFSVLDTKISNFGQIGARIGEKLKHSHERQSRAENALELIEHLQSFSYVGEKGNFAILPPIFTDDDHLEEAAEIAQRLVVLTSDLHSGKARLNDTGDDRSESSVSPSFPRGLNRAVLALQDYCNDLENRVVSHFDRCTDAEDDEGMHQYATIMAKLDKETILAQRYICSRPMFIDIDKLQFAESSSIALMDLQKLYREILTTVKHEAQIIERVFPSSQKAMELFIQRVMEQRVRSALDRVLVEPGENVEPEEIRDFIRLVAQVYGKTHTLAINLERVITDDLNLLQICDELVSDYISNYPQIELDWLSQLYNKQESQKLDNGLSLDVVKILIDWNKEAVLRCKALSSEDLLAPRVRQLFHSSTYYQANLGCLLEQAARHIMHGLRQCCEECELGSNMLLSSSSLHDLSLKTISISANNLISHGIGKMLHGVNVVTQMVEELQVHYRSIVEPQVVSSVAESAACVSGLSALVKAIEEKILEGLKNAIQLFFTQVEKILISEQKRNEYRPSAGMAMVFDRPTIACQLICALIDALRLQALDTLKEPNLTSFLGEVGFEASGCLSVHITHFTFSPPGALRLKRDMAEYIDTMRKFDSNEVLSQFETLQQLVNIFIVAPESLLGLVDGSLRMSHKDALKYVQLREDFKTAKVDGQSLTQLFTSEMNEFD